MGDETTIDAEIIGEWWWIAALLEAAIRQTSIKTDQVLTPSHQPPNGYVVSTINQELGELGTITFTGDENEARIHITAPAQYHAYWQEITDFLRAFAVRADALRQHPTPRLTAEEAIEYYYRLRNTPRRKTLGEIATKNGYSEAYLRKVKVAYDKAGKWGAKRKKR